MNSREGLTDDPIEETQPKKKSYRKVYIIFSVVGVALFCALTSGPRDLFQSAGSIFYKSLSDTFSSRESEKLVAEIDLAAENFGAEGKNASGAIASSDFGVKIKNSAVLASEKQNSTPKKSELITQKSSGEKIAGNNNSVSVISPRVTEKSSSSGSENISAAPVIKNSPAVDTQCVFGTANAPSHDVTVNEIAWMGSLPRNGESVAAAANNEWIELKNNSARRIDLSSWKISDAAGKFKIVFESGDAIAAHGFFLLERADENSVPDVAADKIYSGSLTNSGMHAGIFSDECFISDEINATAGWPGGDNESKKTLERNVNDFGWHTSIAPGGTPRGENSIPATAAISPAPQSNPIAPTSTANNFDVHYTVGISMQGNGSGNIVSNPVGINCGFDCAESYAIGTAVILSAQPASNSVFDGWSGACTGKGNCSFAVSANASVVAMFSLVGGQAQPGSAPSAETPPDSSSSSSVSAHLLIAEIQITGGPGLTTNDFIKIYNPLSVPFNLKGYRLVKRAKISTSDTLIKPWTADVFIPASGYYLWAHSSFLTISETPDATSADSIADDNGIAIRFGPSDTGTIIDSAAWGEAENIFIEGAAYPTNPEANQKLVRKSSGGTFQDTDNNSADFEIK